MKVFNKVLFSEMLKKAKGRRSINQYSIECGISAAHISRFLRDLIDIPPSPKTIEKLCSVAHNGITYNDMMNACGHTSIPSGNEKEILERIIDAIHEKVGDCMAESRETNCEGPMIECQGLITALRIINKYYGGK